MHIMRPRYFDVLTHHNVEPVHTQVTVETRQPKERSCASSLHSLHS